MSGHGTTTKGSSLAEVVQRQLKLLLRCPKAIARMRGVQAGGSTRATA